MFKTRQEAEAKLATVGDENYYQISASRHDILSGVWSKSALKSMACNPLDWFAGTPFRASAKTEFGNLVDCLATEPEKFHTTYHLCAETDKRKKGFLDAKKDADAMGRTVVTTKDVQRAEGAMSALQANKYGRVLLDGKKQQILKGIVRLSGPLGDVWVPLKSRTDSLTEHDDSSITIEDLKTTENSDPDNIRGVCRYLSYHWQDVLYTELGRQMGHEVRDFRFVFVGTGEPFHVQPVKFNIEAREQGMKCIERALHLVYWTGFGHGIEKFFPEELVLGSAPAEAKHYWNTIPDYQFPPIDVIWP